MIFKLAYGILFLIHGLLILNNERFLKQLNFDLENKRHYSQKKQKLVELLASIKIVLKIPVIILSLLGILYELILG